MPYTVLREGTRSLDSFLQSYNMVAEVTEYDLSQDLLDFANIWKKYYHGDTPSLDMKPVHDRLNHYQKNPADYTISAEVEASIQSAIRVFGPGRDRNGKKKPGDKIQGPKDFLDFLKVEEGDRWTEKLIRRVSILTAVVETSLDPDQKIQEGGGPAMSQWQVEPVTALDLVTNSKTLFGEKFEAEFRDGSKMHDGTVRSYQKNGMSVRDSITPTDSQGLLDLSLGSSPVGVGESRERDMSNILLNDTQLAATLSIGKFIQAMQARK